MKLLDRYVLRLLILPFLLGAITVVFLFLLQFLMKYIDQFVGKGLEEWVIARLILLNIAWMVVLAVPMGVLVATLMIYGNLSATHELTVFQASGASPMRLLAVPFIAAVVLSIALYWFNDRILPDANHRAKILLHDIQRKKPLFALTPGQFYNGFEGYQVLARKIDSVRNFLYGLTIYETRYPDRISIISGDSARVQYTEDFRYVVLHLFHGEIYQFFQLGKQRIRRIAFDQHRVFLDGTGFLFSQSDEERFVRGDRELDIAAMRVIVRAAEQEKQKQEERLRKEVDEHMRYLLSGISDSASAQQAERSLQHVQQRVNRLIDWVQFHILATAQQMESAQLRAHRYRVEIQKKYAIPAACVAFLLIGAVLGMLTKRGDFGISAAISLGFYILYWALLIGGEKLADRGWIKPWLGMWSANILIASTAVVLLWKMTHFSRSS